MGWLKTVWQELFGLFVDDGRFAVAILAWLLVVWLVLPRVGVGPAWSGIALFGGLAAILIESTRRRAAS